MFTSPTRSDHWQAAGFDPRGRTERMVTYDTANAAIRSREWVEPVERAIGYVPCMHPEDYYGREVVDIEAVVEHPIAGEPGIMARRGEPIGRHRRTWR